MDHDTLRSIYDEYNSQSFALLDRVTEDVDWPDGAARLSGRIPLRAYWTEQWSRTHVIDIPAVIADLAPGVLVVRVEQTVRSPDGLAPASAVLAHIVHTRGDLIARLDIIALDVPRGTASTGGKA